MVVDPDDSILSLHLSLEQPHKITFVRRFFGKSLWEIPPVNLEELLLHKVRVVGSLDWLPKCTNLRFISLENLDEFIASLWFARSCNRNGVLLHR